MDEGDRPASDDGSGDRADPDGERNDSTAGEADNDERASDRSLDSGSDRDVDAASDQTPDGESNESSDGESDQTPDGESDQNIDFNSGSDNQSANSETVDSDAVEASDESGEAEEKLPHRYPVTENDSSAAGSEPGETGTEGGDSNRTERGHPPERRYPDDRNGEDRESLYHRFRYDNDGALMWIREMLSSVAIVLVLGLLLFGLSGVWPPMVAVESPSMEPNMNTGDLVFVTEPGRFAPDVASNDIGVVTYEEGVATDYRTFGSYGSVIIFQPPSRTASPIIHRAMFHVEEGENWYERADSQYHSAANCEELQHCPAPHGGFITLGDNNGRYDQASGLAEPIRAEWVGGVARVRVPYLGYVRLIATGQAEPGDVLATTRGFQLGGGNAMISGGPSGYGSDGANSHDPGANSYDPGRTSDVGAAF